MKARDKLITIIHKNTAGDFVANCKNSCDKCKHNSCAGFLADKILKKFTEIKKANWLDDSTKKTTFKCSNCGGEPMYQPANNNKAYATLTVYCPHCGCKMSYEDEEL